MIRKANESDIPSISKMLNEILLIHHKLRPDLFKPSGAKFDGDEAISLMKDPNTPVFVYELDGNVVGHLFGRFIVRKEEGHTYPYKEFYVDDLVVKEGFRRRGIGKELLEFASSYAKENGCDYLTLHVWEGNPADRFYLDNGLSVRNRVLEKKL